MDKLKYIMFETRSKLQPEEHGVATVIDHVNSYYDVISGKKLLESLENGLVNFQWSPNTITFLREMKSEIESNDLYYDLQDLYFQIQNENKDNFYESGMDMVTNIMDRNTNSERMMGILTELNQFTWIPQVKKFMMKYVDSPMQKENLNAGAGVGELVYTVVEYVANGQIAWVDNRWLLFTDEAIETTLLESHNINADRMTELKLLKDVVDQAHLEGDKITFEIDENTTLTIDTKNPSNILLNNEPLGENMSIEMLFNSPMIPFQKRNLFQLFVATCNNLANFVLLDVAVKVINVAKPYCRYYAFNYKNKCYLYVVDDKYGSGLYEYTNCMDLIDEVRKETGFDVMYFYGDRANDDIQTDINLADKERVINMEIKDTDDAINQIESEFGNKLAEPDVVDTEMQGAKSDETPEDGLTPDGEIEKSEEDEEDEDEQPLESKSITGLRHVYNQLKVKRIKLEEHLKVVKNARNNHKLKVINSRIK